MCTPFIAYIGLKSKMVALILRFKKQSIFYESSSDGCLTNSLIRLFMEVQLALPNLARWRTCHIYRKS